MKSASIVDGMDREAWLPDAHALLHGPTEAQASAGA